MTYGEINAAISAEHLCFHNYALFLLITYHRVYPKYIPNSGIGGDAVVWWGRGLFHPMFAAIHVGGDVVFPINFVFPAAYATVPE